MNNHITSEYITHQAPTQDEIEENQQGLRRRYPTRRARIDALTRLALSLQHHAHDLRGVNTRTILSITEPFFEAGWTVNDILYACNYRPDGGPWSARALYSTHSKAKWLSMRLAVWQDAGRVVENYRFRRAAGYLLPFPQQADRQGASRHKRSSSVRLGYLMTQPPRA